MHFAAPIPIWLSAALVAALGWVAFFTYRRPLAPLSRIQRVTLTGLRACTLVVLLFFVLRPIVLVPARQGDVIVPVLLDVSRSMRIQDADGQGMSRLAAAVRLLQTAMLPELSRRFTPEIYTVGDGLEPIAAGGIGQAKPEARHSNLVSALSSISERYRGRRVSGVVLLSDGGDTSESQDGQDPENDSTVPVFAVGLGKVDGLRDREVLAVAAGDPQLDQASVDLRVSAVSHGYGRQPFDIEVRANGRLLQSRRVTPAADGTPIDELFTVVPDQNVPTVLTVNIPAGDGEAITENNSRGILVNPAGRRRRILLIEGTAGFEHSFLARALAADLGLDVDAVVRKGKNDSGKDTFLVQAGGNRAALLTAGFPPRPEDLFAYDTVIVANVEGDFFTRAQLATLAEFVGERGGGLLVMGGRSFAQRGLIGTPVEEVLPVELNDRRGAPPAALGLVASAPINTVVMTPDGEQHPVMRIGSTLEETRKRWAALPSLAAVAPLGGPRPGASVLAFAATPAGLYPVVAVQRYGRGRAMIFGGEAAWRWRMQLPSGDHSYEYFWRQSARWLAGASPDPLTLTLPASAEPGDSTTVEIEARDAAYAPASDASVDATVVNPSGTSQSLTLRSGARAGTFTAALGLGQPGLYRVHAEARRGTTPLGVADRWLNVGGGDREFADPRLNEGVLRRIALASGGRYVTAADVASVTQALEAAVPQDAEPERRDIWHQPWTYALAIALLSAEWVLRRRWGLR
jgi:uncharacterized membrane protein